MVRYIEDDILRDFYMFLFVYIHGDDPDFNNIIEYLKTKTKCLIVEKYSNYCNYMKEREDIQVEEENYNNEKEKLNNTIAYLEDLKQKLDNLIETKTKLINHLTSKIEEKEDGNN
jgi:chromosome segregation ATPase